MTSGEQAVPASRATGIGVISILLWASLALLTVLAGNIPPFELLTLCFGVAFFAGITVLGLKGRASLARLRQPPLPWLVAFLAIFLYHALYFFALSTVPAARASLIAYLWPLLIVLMSAMSSGERRLRPRHLGGALLGLAGTMLVMTRQGAGHGPGNPVLGYTAAFGCALIWSTYSVLNRRFHRTSSETVIGVCGAVAAMGAACHVALEPKTIWPHFPQWIAVIGLGIGPTGLAFLAWDHATKHGNVPLLGALSYLAPLVSTTLLVVAGEAPATASLLFAALLVISGAVLATGLRASIQGVSKEGRIHDP